MENNETKNLVENNSQDELNLFTDEPSKDFLNETARWCKFLSIVGFIALGLLVIFAIYLLITLQRVQYYYNSDYNVGTAIGLLVSAILYAFPCYYMYKFAVEMKHGLLERNKSRVVTGFQNLKSLFKFTGILTIVILAFYVLVFVVGLSRA